MPVQFISKAVGIDLGTTNSAVSVMNPTDSDIIIHRDAAVKRETTPSCVWRDPRSGEIVVGHKAFRRVGSSPSPVRSIKRMMGQQTTVALTDIEATPEQISSYILSEMKRQIEQDVQTFSSDSTQWIVDRAIITVPAYFDQPQIDATRRAGEMAGLQVIDLLHEPTAAACYHCWKTGTQNGVFLVYDFGGGTFDVSILRATAGAFEVLGVSGNNRLGGDDLDAEIAELLIERLLREDYALELDLRSDPEDRLRFDMLKFLAESIKKGLSSEGEFLLRDTWSIRDKENNQVIIDMMFERQEIERIIKPIAERTVPYCFDAIEKAKAKLKDDAFGLSSIDTIILAGGSTHIPMVREMVRQNLCAEPGSRELIVDELAVQARARCATPLYKKVDTLVSLGAAVRAAAVGGLAIYNPNRTVRVSFRGTGLTGASHTHIGGKVEAFDPAIELTGGSVQLIISDLGFEDDQDLMEGGTFGFRQVPLQQSAENLLAFNIYDRNRSLIATAGRPVSHTKEPVPPTGGVGGTSVLSKAISLEVERGGKPHIKELFPALTTLPVRGVFNFSHPGRTELLLLILYQHKKKIQEIKVRVPSSLPRGTHIMLDINIDKLSLITVKGTIGEEVEIGVSVELPPPRDMPSSDEIQSLERAFGEAIGYLSTGRRSIAEAKYRKSRKSFEAAVSRGDNEQAIHDFEEMEEIVAEISCVEGPLQPVKEYFDELVGECIEINQYVAVKAAEAKQPHDTREISKAVEAQRVHGERAYRDGDQKAYSDAITMLESIKDHMIEIMRKIMPPPPPMPESEKARRMAEHAKEEVSRVGQLAKAQKRDDLQKEIGEIRKQLETLAQEAETNPQPVQEKLSQLRARLEQIKNVLMGKVPDPEEGSLPQDHSAKRVRP